MDRTLLKDFWKCGDNQLIQFAMLRARLNREEKDILECILDECMTQEETSELINISTRKVQELWYSASDKLLQIPWVMAYAKDIRGGA